MVYIQDDSPDSHSLDDTIQALIGIPSQLRGSSSFQEDYSHSQPEKHNNTPTGYDACSGQHSIFLFDITIDDQAGSLLPGTQLGTGYIGCIRSLQCTSQTVQTLASIPGLRDVQFLIACILSKTGGWESWGMRSMQTLYHPIMSYHSVPFVWVHQHSERLSSRVPTHESSNVWIANDAS